MHIYEIKLSFLLNMNYNINVYLLNDYAALLSNRPSKG